MSGDRSPSVTDSIGNMPPCDKNPLVPKESARENASPSLQRKQIITTDIASPPCSSSALKGGGLELRRSAVKPSLTPRSGNNNHALFTRSRRKNKKAALRRKSSQDSAGSSHSHPKNYPQITQDAEELDPDHVKKSQSSHYLSGFPSRILFPSTSHAAAETQSDLTIVFPRVTYTLPSSLPFLQPVLQLVTFVFRPIIHVFNVIASELKSAKTYLHRKYSTFSPFQRLLMIFALILWKFVQIWIVTTFMIWLHRNSSGIDSMIAAENEVVVGNGKMPNISHMTKDRERQRDLMDRQQLQSMLLEQHRHHDSKGVNAAEKQSSLFSVKKVLYIVTISCPYSSSQNDRDGINDINDKSSNRLQNEDGNNPPSFNSTISTLVDNVRSIINSSHVATSFRVDVYLILGCTSKDLDLEFDHSEDSREGNYSSVSLDSRVRHFLPNGVGLEIWEDAMPYELTHAANGDATNSGGSRSHILSDAVWGENFDNAAFQSTHDERTRRTDQSFVSAGKVSLNEKRRLDEKTTQQQSGIGANTMKKNPTNAGDASAAAAIDPKRETPTGMEQDDYDILDVVVRPSLSKFMKQHRYVVRDKLNEYDVFLSFFAHLTQPQNLAIGGKPLERITHDHVTTYLEMSSMLNEWKTNLKLHFSAKEDASRDELIPALLIANISTKSTKDDVFPDANLWIDAYPCCGHLFPEIERVSDARHVSFEVSMVGEKSNFRKDTNYVWDFHDIGIGTSESTSGEQSNMNWMATLTNSAKSISPFFENGWILRRDQILRMNHGVCRGKFLPPFDFDYESDHIIGNPNRMGGQDFASPLFRPKEDGGCGMKRTVSLDPRQFSRQLVYSSKGIEIKSVEGGSSKAAFCISAKKMLYDLLRSRMTMQIP